MFAIHESGRHHMNPNTGNLHPIEVMRILEDVVNVQRITGPDWDENLDYVDGEERVPVKPSYVSNAATMPVVATYRL